jgi:hypothetical protein
MHKTASKEVRERSKELRQRRQWRDSEVDEAIRHDHSDRPEMEDARGGTALGKQRAASRSWQNTATKRQLMVVTNNMGKLVDNPLGADPLLPTPNRLPTRSPRRDREGQCTVEPSEESRRQGHFHCGVERPRAWFELFLLLLRMPRTRITAGRG